MVLHCQWQSITLKVVILSTNFIIITGLLITMVRTKYRIWNKSNIYIYTVTDKKISWYRNLNLSDNMYCVLIVYNL